MGVHDSQNSVKSRFEIRDSFNLDVKWSVLPFTQDKHCYFHSITSQKKKGFQTSVVLCIYKVYNDFKVFVE